MKSTSQKRNDIVAKNVAFIFGVLAFAALVIMLLMFGPNINSPIIAGLGFFFFGIRYAISRGYSVSSKLVLCTLPPVVTFIAALLPKLYTPDFNDILYYDARFVFVLLSIIPCLIFDLRERVALGITLGLILVIIIAFDPVHNWLGVGYYQKGFTSTSYYFMNYITIICFVGIVAGALTLKQSVYVSEAKYRLTFQRLALAFKNLKKQNEQITTQQGDLMKAAKLIETQKLALQERVEQINANLQNANDELVRHNNELTQFSYAVSHNLRGPIARLLGLANILTIDGSFDRANDGPLIVKHIQQSARDLDEIIKDLGQIVDIRNNVLQRTEVIRWDTEWQKTRGLLNLPDHFVHQHIAIDFSCDYVHGVRMMVGSILYNLVSNAIKYQSPERPLQIEIKTYRENGHSILEVADNGLGIDLNAFGGDVFKMYKRFHTHQDGKGIGLYLVKTQVDALNGFIELKSRPNEGSLFRVRFPINVSG